jgi:hypothetical protein
LPLKWNKSFKSGFIIHGQKLSFHEEVVST